MPFTIPNAANAEDVTQAQPDSVDFSILVAAFAGTGVVSGCAVTAQASPNMTVAVANGTVAVGGTQVGVTAGNVTLAAADPSNPRFSLIVASNSGVLSAVPGTASANPVFPAIPANSVVLAAVRVPAGAASINGPKITDKRVAPVIAPTIPQSFQTGMMMPWPTAVAPAGWQACDGSLLSRTGQSALFSVIGTLYGAGDGSTTFNVPDLRGRAPVGIGGAGGHADVNACGNNEGQPLANRRQAHAHTVNLQLPNHVHTQALTLPDHGHSNNFSLPDHAHANTFTLPNHGHSISGLALPDHVHGNSFTLPVHAHADSINFVDNGHSHVVMAQYRYDRGVAADNIVLMTTSDSTGHDPISSVNLGANTSYASLAKSGSVGNPTTNPAINGSIGSPTSFPAISGSVGNPTSNPGLPGAVGSVTTTPAIIGSVGSITSSPAINGAIGNPTSQPNVPGSVGAVGSAINDEAAYLVVNFIIKL